MTNFAIPGLMGTPPSNHARSAVVGPSGVLSFVFHIQAPGEPEPVVAASGRTLAGTEWLTPASAVPVTDGTTDEDGYTHWRVTLDASALEIPRGVSTLQIWIRNTGELQTWTIDNPGILFTPENGDMTLIINAGTAFSREFAFQGPHGEPMDLTGATVTAAVLTTPETPFTITVDADPTTGLITMTMTLELVEELTAVLAPEHTVPWTMRLLESGAVTPRTLISGQIIIDV